MEWMEACTCLFPKTCSCPFTGFPPACKTGMICSIESCAGLHVQNFRCYSNHCVLLLFFNNDADCDLTSRYGLCVYWLSIARFTGAIIIVDILQC